MSYCQRLLVPGLQGLARPEAENRLAAADQITEVRELPAQQPPGRVSAQLSLPGVEVARRTRVARRRGAGRGAEKFAAPVKRNNPMAVDLSPALAAGTAEGARRRVLQADDNMRAFPPKARTV